MLVRFTGGKRIASAETKKTRLAALGPGENIKEKQQKLKEEREAKRNQLDERHAYILQAVADSLGVDKSEIEDAILEGNQIEIMKNFLDADGTSHLMFFYQEPEQDKDTVEHLKLGPGGNKPMRTLKPKVFVTDGRDAPLHGLCLLFTRPSPSIAITEANIMKEINFTQLDTGAKDNGYGLLHAVEHLLSTVFVPSLRSLDKGWGTLDSKEGATIKSDFLNNLDGFVDTLIGAQESLQDKVSLKPCETYDLRTIHAPSDYQAVANSTEALQCIEDCIAVWIKQIEQVGPVYNLM